MQGKIKVNHDLRIDNVEQRPLPLKDKKNALIFEFVFNINYEPGVGEVALQGNVLYYDDQKKLDAIAQQWKKTKKVAPEVSVEVINVIFARCNIRALELSQELNLPAHLPLPQINLKEDPSKYIG